MTPPLRRQFSLLYTVATFRLLFLATLGSGLGNWLALIALQVDVYDRTNHSGWWVGGVLVATIGPAVALGLLFGPLVDRLSRKGLMIGSDLGRLAVFAALPFVGSAAAIVVLAALAGVGNAFYRPAVLAGVPNLVDDEQLPQANALLQLVEWGTTALGPLAGGAIVALSGPHLAYWLNAGTFAVSAGLVALIPAALLQSEKPVGRGYWRDLRDGFRTVVHSEMLRTVLIAWTVVMIAAGCINLGEIFLAKRSYSAGDFGFGLLWAASGIGLIAGGLMANSLSQRFGVRRVYPRSMLLFALGVAGAAAAPNVWIGAVAMVVGGVGNGIAVVTNITLVQRGAPDRIRGRALTSIMAVNYAMLLAVFLAAGPLVDAVGARAVFSVAAGALVVASLTAMRLLGSEPAVAAEQAA